MNKYWIDKCSVDRYWLTYIIINIVFLLFLLNGFSYQLSDENVYFYMGSLVSEGETPYKDFFYAHPPLLVYVLGLLNLVFGFNVVMLKLVPVASLILGGYFISRIFFQLDKKAEGLVFILVYLFSFSILDMATNAIGIHFCILMIVLGVYSFYTRRYLLSGIFLGLGLMTRLFGVYFIALFFIYLLLYRRRNILKVMNGFILTGGIIGGYFILVSNGEFIQQVVYYHFMKEALLSNFFSMLIYSVQLNIIVYLGLLLYLFAEKNRFMNYVYAASIVYIALLMLSKTLFVYYFLMVFPLLAILTAYSLVQLFNRLNLKRGLSYLIVFLILSGCIFGIKNFQQDKYAYGLNEAVDFVEAHANEDGVIVGDSDITPLISLLSQRKIAGSNVDLNDQLFFSGMIHPHDFFKLLKEEAKYVFIRKDRGIDKVEEIYVFLQECELLQEFEDKNYEHHPLQVYQC